MDVFSRMLVAVDGSPPSTAGQRLALRLARGSATAVVRFISVLDRDLRADHTLEFARAEARAAGVRADTTLRRGIAARQILAEAELWNASCIVIGTHGRGGVSRAFLGSCAEAVLRGSARPVLLTRISAARDGAERILCAYDGSPAAEAAFHVALQLATERGGELHLLSVVQIDDLYATGYERDRFDPDGSIGAIYDEARRPLKRLAAEAASRGVTSATHVAGGASVAAVVGSRALEYGTGLIVMGTHGRRGLSRVVLGSVADEVVRTAGSPVVVVRERARFAADELSDPDVAAAART